MNDTSYQRYLITGNPNIGKTYFGKLMLTKLLKENKSVLLLIRYGLNLQVNYTMCHQAILQTIAEQPNFWYIIDGKKDQLGHDFLMDGEFTKEINSW